MNKPDRPETGKPDAAGAAPKPKKKHTALKVILIILGVIVALGIAAAVSAYAYYRHVFNQIILPETVEYVIPPSSEFFETDEPWWEIETDPFVDTEDTAPPATEPADPVSGEPATEGPVTEGNPDTQGGGKTTKDTGPVVPVTTESGRGATEPPGTVTESADTDIGDTEVTEPPEPVTDEPGTVPPDTEPPATDIPEITGPDETEPPDTESPASGTEPPAPDTEPPTSDTEPPESDTAPPTSDTEPPTPDTEPPVPDTEPFVVPPGGIPTVDPADVVWPSYVRPI
ncbi:MAG: hypothetical protein ILO42_04090, partial [Clostridia bacterium]|nr:hypothetical protein [Clostridia bacterium]